MQGMAGRVRQELCHLNAPDWGDHTGAVDVCHICGKWTCEGHLEKVGVIQSTDEYQHFCPRSWKTRRSGESPNTWIETGMG